MLIYLLDISDLLRNRLSETKLQKFNCWHADMCFSMVRGELDGKLHAATEYWKGLESIKWDDPSGNWGYSKLAAMPFDTIPLGTLAHNDSKTAWRLLPSAAALDLSPEDQLDTELPWAPGTALAIAYDTGHPSDDETLGLQTLPQQDSLFRFQTLGWIEQTRGRGWYMTGHVLVLDLYRLKPWIVLAKMFHDSESGEEIEVPKSIPKDVPCTPGVLPGDRNRTPVGKLLGDFGGPITSWFGESKVFEVERTGGNTHDDRRRKKGPTLATIMEWFTDKNGDEVCYCAGDIDCYRWRNGGPIQTLGQPPLC